VSARWLVVLLAAAALVVTPLAVQARPIQQSGADVSQLTEQVRTSGSVPWSGFVQTSGTLQIPDSESFANLAQLLGEQNSLRVWWRSTDDWRVDRIRSTGETDLFRRGDTSTRWVFESNTATVAPVSSVRLPDASDLLPPTLGRSLLQGARPDEVVRLPHRRIAGVAAPGLRLTPRDAATSVGRVDLWADPQTGLPLRVEVYGLGEERPALTTTLLSVNLDEPASATTDFDPPSSTTVSYEDAVDVAASANAFAPYDLPATLAGLPVRDGRYPGAVGIYGRGPTTLIALPLRGNVAGPLRGRLQDSASAVETPNGTLVPLGPIGLLVTDDWGAGFLLAGTVTGETLQRAAAELADVR
jgi:outer membrane lipoprotein-sorting protein